MKELLDEKKKSDILISEMNDEISKKYLKYENGLKNQIQDFNYYFLFKFIYNKLIYLFIK